MIDRLFLEVKSQLLAGKGNVRKPVLLVSREESYSTGRKDVVITLCVLIRPVRRGPGTETLKHGRF